MSMDMNAFMNHWREDFGRLRDDLSKSLDQLREDIEKKSDLKWVEAKFEPIEKSLERMEARCDVFEEQTRQKLESLDREKLNTKTVRWLWSALAGGSSLITGVIVKLFG